MSSGNRRRSHTPAELFRVNLLLHILPDAILMACASYLSLLLRLNWDAFLAESHHLQPLIPFFVGVRILVLFLCGVYRIIWRYISLSDAVVLVRSILLAQVICIAGTYFIDIGNIPRSTFVISALLNVVFLCGIRFARRVIHEYRSGVKLSAVGRRALIYGAGTNGRTLLQRFKNDPSFGFQVVGFIDDDQRKVSRDLLGVPVLGARDDLATLLGVHQIQELIIAISQPKGEVLRNVMEICLKANIRPRLIKPPTTSANGKGIELYRDIELNDLLTRKRRDIDLGAAKSMLRNRTVLITGAGGSIGSELARQILSFRPRRLLLLDHSEYNLYQIDHELRLSQDATHVVTPLLVDIKDRPSLEHVFATYRPEFVFHAAAYKHVHLVESNPYPAILNNILGTENLLDLSEDFEVERFVLISSDKAVNPAGLMGATKRICELLVAEAGLRTQRPYAAVRFGNVLGSSGSLIPMLKRQIEDGGPLTLTDEKMKRYFMLIPEAVSLVLKAGSIARPADIMVLRMGEPMKIVEIAQSLLTLMGKSEAEVPIIFTGARPGEKMFEELYLTGAEIRTEDPDVLVIPKGDSAFEDAVEDRVAELIAAAQKSDPGALRLVKSLVRSEYYPAAKPGAAKGEPLVMPHVSPSPQTAETLN